jgi:hypothetical protein
MVVRNSPLDLTIQGCVDACAIETERGLRGGDAHEEWQTSDCGMFISCVKCMGKREEVKYHVATERERLCTVKCISPFMCTRNDYLVHKTSP